MIEMNYLDTHTHTQAQTNVPLPDNLPPPENELHVIRK